MKRKLIILLLTFMTGPGANAQQKLTLKELIGTWDVFSMDIPGEIYFNLHTDSIAVKPTEGEDSSMTAFKNDMIKASLKEQVSKMKFVMDSDGVMYDGAGVKDSSNKMGEFNEEKGSLFIKEKNGTETKEIKLQLKDGILSMVTEDKGVTVTMLCKKTM